VLEPYVGEREVFDRAITRFGFAHADQVARDHAAFEADILKCRIEADLER
jgi:hypothetical protein